MKILCLVKFVSDVASFQYDYEKNVLVRHNVELLINPDDACALAYALKLKREQGAFVEVLSMGPLGVQDLLRDLLRRGVDKATLLSDKRFAGSDTYATSLILGRYLQNAQYDMILAGTQTQDSDTAHVPAQVAELLGLPHMSGILRIDASLAPTGCGQDNRQTSEATEYRSGVPQSSSAADGAIKCEVEAYDTVYTFAIGLPSVLGIAKESGYKLPFVRFADMELNVDDRLHVLTNAELGCTEDMIGLYASPTRVAKSWTAEPVQHRPRAKVIIDNIDDGVEAVHRLLKEKGFVNG